MHLIFATSIVPDGAASTGYEIANNAVISALRRAGIRLTVVGFCWPGKRPEDPENTVVLGEIDVRNDNAGAGQKAAWVANAVRLGLPVTSAKLRIIEPRQLSSTLASLEPIDGFVLNAVAISGAFEECFKDRPSIYVAHNVEHRSAWENAQTASSLVQRTLFAREARLLNELENRLCANSDFVFTLASEDQTDFGLDSSRSAVLPLTVREELPKRRSPEDIVHDCTLIGTWTWQPNRVGLEWFLGRVLPLMDRKIRVAVAGDAADDLRSNFPDVHWAGRVDDATDFIRSGSVVPLISRSGTGVQLKTIEAFELGLPSVATSHSLRGLDTVPINCEVTDDPDEFAAALTKKIGAARDGSLDLDGSEFWHRQRQELDRRISAALDIFALEPLRAAV